MCELASGGTTRGDGIKENMSGKQERQPLDDAFHVRQRLSSLMMGLSRVSKVSSGQSQHLEEQRWMDSLCMTTSAPIVRAADCLIFSPSEWEKNDSKLKHHPQRSFSFTKNVQISAKLFDPTAALFLTMSDIQFHNRAEQA